MYQQKVSLNYQPDICVNDYKPTQTACKNERPKNSITSWTVPNFQLFKVWKSRFWHESLYTQYEKNLPKAIIIHVKKTRMDRLVLEKEVPSRKEKIKMY